MVEKLEDLLLPASVVSRLIKEALPEGTIVSKEARATISRAASVFVIFITAQSTALAKNEKHKTLSANNIIEALEQWDMTDILTKLKGDLELYRKMIKEKKDAKTKPAKEPAIADIEDIIKDK